MNKIAGQSSFTFCLPSLIRWFLLHNVRIQRTAKAQLLTVRWNDLLGMLFADVVPFILRQRLHELVNLLKTPMCCSPFDVFTEPQHL